MSDSGLKNTFLVLGALGVYLYGSGVYNCLDYMTISMLWGGIYFLLAATGLAAGLAYFLFGFKYDDYRHTKVELVEKVCQASIVVGIVEPLLLSPLFIGRFHWSDMIIGLISALVSFVALNQVRT